ncbi:hypothetical protein ACQKWADRAFT_289293, partial [Trichoderma austrokoningii]
MEHHPLYGFDFESDSVLLSARNGLGLSGEEFMHLQHTLERDIQASSMQPPSPNDRYLASQIAAAEYFSMQNDGARDSHNQHATQPDDAHEDTHPPQPTDWDHSSDTTAGGSVDTYSSEPQYPSSSPDAERGFDSDDESSDEDGDRRMDLSEDESDVEAEEDGVVIHVLREVPIIRISRFYVYDSNVYAGIFPIGEILVFERL